MPPAQVEQLLQTGAGGLAQAEVRLRLQRYEPNRLAPHLPAMQAIFDSTSLTLLEWGKVVAAGLLVFCIAEMEKLVVRRTSLAARLRLA